MIRVYIVVVVGVEANGVFLILKCLSWFNTGHFHSRWDYINDTELIILLVSGGEFHHNRIRFELCVVLDW